MKKTTINKKLKKSKIEPIKPIDVNTLPLYQLCRWAALKDAVDIVGDKCDERKMSFDDIDLQPLDILKYVDIATDQLYSKMVNATESN
jgi:hypothetical protein